MVRSVFVSVILCALRVKSLSKVNKSDLEMWQTQDFALYPKLPIGMTWSEDSDCRRDSEILVKGLKAHTYWAMQMYDSSPQTPYGILHGNTFHMGSFDECMMVKKPIRSHMCVLHLNADVTPISVSGHTPFALEPPHDEIVWKKFKDSRIDESKKPRDSLVLALCVPRTCSSRHVQDALNVYLRNHHGNAGLGNRSAYSVTLDGECVNDDPDPIRPDEFAFWAFCATLVIVAIGSTILDIYSDSDDLKKETMGKRLIMSFSIKRNIVQFLAREGDGGPLDFLYGIKFVTICLIIYDHRCAIFLGSPVFNYQKIEEELRGYNNLFMPHGDLLVDTFFFIGGLLSCHLMMSMSMKRHINPLLIIFGRYVRLAPLHLFMVWFYASGLLRLGSGPVWKAGVGNESHFCRDNWWTNALFVNNYVNSEEMCMMQTWYLSCDFHFFIICIMLVLLLRKNKGLGLTVLATLTIASSIVPAVLASIYQLKPTVIFYHDFLSMPRLDSTYLYLYIKSHTRATVYLIGVISGYFLFTSRQSTTRYGTCISLIGNGLGLGLMFAPMLYGSQYYHPGREYDPLESGLFAAFRRVVWAIGCVVIMFTYRFGRVPLIGDLCSSRTMIVLSKLSYGMYLIHFIYQVSDHAKSRLPHYLNLYDLFTVGTSDVVASMLYALLTYLLIELPARSIFKQLIFSRTEKPSQDINKHSTNSTIIVKPV